MIDKIREIAAEVFELESEQVHDKLRRDEVDLWDSLAQLRLVSTLEAEFGIQLTMTEIESIDGIGRVIELVGAHTGAAR
jgi:acyl carrier protein